MRTGEATRTPCSGWTTRYAKLYGLNEQELRYILDPADVYGEDYPSESFRVLKEKEIAEFGEYRTRRLVLEAFQRAGECGGTVPVAQNSNLKEQG